MASTRKAIGELLVDNGQITPEELEQAEAETKKTGEPIGIVLSKLGFISESSLKNALELQYGVNYINLSKREPEAELISLLPEDVIREQFAVPVSQQGERLTVAMVDPSDSKALDELKKNLNGKQIKTVVCLEEQFSAFVDKAFGTEEKTTNGSEPEGQKVVESAESPKEEAAEPVEAKHEEAAVAKPATSIQEKSAEPAEQKSAESIEAKSGESGEAKSAEPAQEKSAESREAKSAESAEPESKSAESVEAKSAEPEAQSSGSAEAKSTEPAQESEQPSHGKSAEQAKNESAEHPASHSPAHSDQPVFDTQEMKARPAPGAAPAQENKAEREEAPHKSESVDIVSEVDLAKRAQEEAIVLLANQILGSAIKRHCSNIHITMGSRESLVHYRLNGRLVVDRKLPNTVVTALVARYKMMARLNLAERKEPQDGHIKVKSASKEIVCLISVVPTDHGESVVIWIV